MPQAPATSTAIAQELQQEYQEIRRFYSFKDTIGNGGFGKVKLAEHRVTGEQVAIKIIDKKKVFKDIERIKMEIFALKQLCHQHLCQLFQVVETKHFYFIVLEYCSCGELFDFIVQHQRLIEDDARVLFRQVVGAVAYMHDQNYAHRDLKPENMLLDTNMNIKVIDLGLCAQIKPTSAGSNTKSNMPVYEPLQTCCGSPAYAAPELVTAQMYQGEKVDAWSLGVLLYALVCGCLPFDDPSIPKLYEKIKKAKYVFPSDVSLSKDTQVLLSKLLDPNPRTRISVRQLCIEPWMLKNHDAPVPRESIMCRSDPKTKNDFDMEIIDFLVRGLCFDSREALISELEKWNYDNYTAFYMLLEQRKKSGKPFLPIPNGNGGSVYHFSGGQENVDPSRPPQTPTMKEALLTPLHHKRKPITSASKNGPGPMYPGTPKSPSESNLHHPVNQPHAPQPPMRKQSFKPKTNGYTPLMNPLSPSPQPKIQSSGKHPRAFSVDRGTPSDALDSGDLCGTPNAVNSTNGSGSNVVTPKRQKRNVFDKFVNFLTPSKDGASSSGNTSAIKQHLSRNSGASLFKIVKPTNPNVSVTRFTDPSLLLKTLEHNLTAKSMKIIPHNFLLQVTINDDWGNAKLVFSFEVVQIAGVPYFAIKRKRITGDVWAYKSICETIIGEVCDPIDKNCGHPIPPSISRPPPTLHGQQSTSFSITPGDSNSMTTQQIQSTGGQTFV